jgi:hypothetical protein
MRRVDSAESAGQRQAQSRTSDEYATGWLTTRNLKPRTRIECESRPQPSINPHRTFCVG